MREEEGTSDASRDQGFHAGQEPAYEAAYDGTVMTNIPKTLG